MSMLCTVERFLSQHALSEMSVLLNRACDFSGFFSWFQDFFLQISPCFNIFMKDEK